ncbi:hypothetical protein EVAR_89036_1 [Eumeta japonica]|uniref:Uncharacterized protein n=1 Tax=Eumeta variegata TaxID=151549 RepID=A0A4C1Z0Q6_EUMVA|nr:hypothetical protein EVAR_89036_1 [Eumeta japonica]
MARKYMERRFSKSHRTTIPASFKIPEPYEFYNKATPFVQRTLLFVADEHSGPAPRAADSVEPSPADGDVKDANPSTSKPREEQEKSPKKSSFFFSPSKSCKIHGRSFFRLPTSPKKSKPEAGAAGGGDDAVAAGAGAAGGAGCNDASPGLISYAPGWSLKGEHLMKWQASGKTTIEVTRRRETPPARARHAVVISDLA